MYVRANRENGAVAFGVISGACRIWKIDPFVPRVAFAILSVVALPVILPVLYFIVAATAPVDGKNGFPEKFEGKKASTFSRRAGDYQKGERPKF